MADSTPVSATFIFVDRRKTGRGKSLPNRQKLLKRIQDSIKNSRPEDIDAQGVKSASSAPAKQLANPVKIAREALNEPTFRYATQSGELDIVLPGNDRWLKGDEFPLDGDDDGQSGAGPGDNGEDDFVIHVNRNEFYDIFFADCELPDLEQSTEKELPEAILKPAGFQKEGNPGSLSVIRSYRNSIGRRKALTFEDREELESLQLRLDVLMLNNAERDGAVHEDWIAEIQAINRRMIEIRERIAKLPLFEKVDHRYRKTERVMVKSADAVLMMTMDISGSMDEGKKRTARKFFSLQYAFIKRKYPNTDLVFIWHTDDAEECDEETFFTTRVNGGTQISPAIELSHTVIKRDYDANVTNIYWSYAGDCDNFDFDNKLIITAMEDHGFLSKLRHAVVCQVGEEMNGYGGHIGGQTKCWRIFQSIANTSKKLHLVKIEDDNAVFDAFKKVYGKKSSKST